MMRSVYVIVSCLSLVHGGHKSSEGCSVAGVIGNDLIQSAFLIFDGFITYRARLSEMATLSEGLSCLAVPTRGINSSQPIGLRFGILEASDSASCSFPVSVFTGYRGLGAADIEHCNPAVYKTDPWACAAGDWSGKFGGMDLGISHLARNISNVPANSSALWLTEELKVHHDPVAIPSCLLDGKTLGVFCADGSVAGCTTLRTISRGSTQKRMWAGMKFFSDHAPLGGCGSGRPTNSSGIPQFDYVSPRTVETGKISPGPLVSNSRGTVTNWWEEFRKRGNDLWQRGKVVMGEGK